MPLRSFRVLIVDDNRSDRLVLTALLKSLNLERVDEAEDVLESLHQLGAAHDFGAPFDLLLLDWEMPGATGLKLLQKVRADERFRDIGVFMVTGKANRARVEEAIGAKVDDFILKPVRREDLAQKLEAYAKKRRAG